MTFSSFDDVNHFLLDYMPPIGGVFQAYRLDRIEKLVAELGHPQHKFKVIHVAGTSGKTSTCYYIASLLQQTGKKVGLTVSPHVDEINERLQINLTPVPEEQYCKLFGEFIDIMQATGVKPTYFELLIAFAYWVFAREGVEYAVIEVGLGGLLDSTNVINRPDKVCVITDIGLDHTHILGRTEPEIAAQKAGIIKPHNPVFMYEQKEPVMEVVREVSRQQQAELHEVWPLQAKELPAHMPIFQRRNWYLALSVVKYVSERDNLPELTEQQLAESTLTCVPARMEILQVGGKTIVLDGAHNPQKMKAFIGSLKARFPKSSFAVLFSLVHHKNASLRSVLKIVGPVANHLIITSFETDEDNHHRSVNIVKIAEAYHTMGYDNWETITNPREAFQALLKRKEDVLVVTGSFYLLNHIRPLTRQIENGQL